MYVLRLIEALPDGQLQTAEQTFPTLHEASMAYKRLLERDVTISVSVTSSEKGCAYLFQEFPARRLLAQAQRLNLSPTDLEERVQTAKAHEAEGINAQGLGAQIEFLVAVYGEDGVREMLR